MTHNPEAGHRPKNYCRACGQDFSSIIGFDAHRVGEYGIDRRCLTPLEIQGKGYVLENGYWIDQANRERTRKYFGK